MAQLKLPRLVIPGIWIRPACIGALGMCDVRRTWSTTMFRIYNIRRVYPVIALPIYADPMTSEKVAPSGQKKTYILM